MVTNTEYLNTLDALSRIRDVCKGELALPQLCVVGDQSSGKSSLLQCITGVSFPVKSGICTRVPTVVQCRRADEPLYELRGAPEAPFEVVSFEDVEKAISKKQKTLLASESQADESSKKQKVSRTEITLRASGPNQMDLQIVDLPGIIHNGEGKDLTVELIDTYIKPLQTLILLVSEAKQDDELTSALELARRHDPRGTRTLRILTKFDTFDSDDARLSATRSVMNRVEDPLGPHAVVCRSQGAHLYDEESELECFDGPSVLPTGRRGISSLKERLPERFIHLIRTNLPGLEQAAQARIQHCKEGLRKLGDAPLVPLAMIRECQRALSLPSRSLATAITPAFTRFQEAIHATETKMTVEWVGHFVAENVFQNPFYQGESAFAQCMDGILDWWRIPTERYLHEVECLLADSMTNLLDDSVGVSKQLREAITKRWDVDHEAMIKELRAVFKGVLDKSVEFGTANHYLYEKFVEQQIMPDAWIDQVVDSLSASSSTLLVSVEQSTSLTPAIQSGFQQLGAVNSLPPLSDAEITTIAKKLYTAISTVLSEDVCDHFNAQSRDGQHIKMEVQRLLSPEFFKIHLQPQPHRSRPGYTGPGTAPFMPGELTALVLKEALSNPAHAPKATLNCEAIREVLQAERAKAVAVGERRALHEHIIDRTLNAVKAAWCVEKKTVTDAILKETRDLVIQRRNHWVKETLLIDPNLLRFAVEDADVGEQRANFTESIAAMKQVIEEVMQLHG